MSYLQNYSTVKTPQSEPIPGSTQVPNNAGGHAWQVSDKERVRRFLILGSEGGSYYVGERKLTIENAEAVRRYIENEPAHALAMAVDVSRGGRAPKNDPAIFVLAMAIGSRDEHTRRAAADLIPVICRTGTHLFTFMEFVKQFRGRGRILQRGLANWYTRDDATVDEIAYQVVKYRQRNSWTHRDVLRLARPTPPSAEHNALFGWIIGNEVPDAELPEIVRAYGRAQLAVTPQETADAIRATPSLPREALKTDHLNDPAVWYALLENGMPMTALIRNLATMTRNGVLKPGTKATADVCEQITDQARIVGARVHPLQVLVALKTYESGVSARGDNNWDPITSIVDALDRAFYASFGNVEPTGKRMMLALDVSGSMDCGTIAGMPGITPRIGSAAMALVTASVETTCFINGFSDTFVPLTISPRQRLDDVVRTINRLPFAGTDCAIPMLYAMQHEVEIDTFVVYTDNETWFGRLHPSQALEQYRRQSGINAKLVVVGMEANEFSIADPNDPGMLDVVGFDTATPNVISEFSVA